MGFFSEVDITIREMIEKGSSRKQVREAFPMLREDEIDAYFDNEHDGDSDDIATEDEFVAEYDDAMDGDFDSAMASAGFGTDEDYGYYGEDY